MPSLLFLEGFLFPFNMHLWKPEVRFVGNQNRLVSERSEIMQQSFIYAGQAWQVVNGIDVQ